MDEQGSSSNSAAAVRTWSICNVWKCIIWNCLREEIWELIARLEQCIDSIRGSKKKTFSTGESNYHNFPLWWCRRMAWHRDMRGRNLVRSEAWGAGDAVAIVGSRVVVQHASRGHKLPPPPRVPRATTDSPRRSRSSPPGSSHRRREPRPGPRSPSQHILLEPCLVQLQAKEEKNQAKKLIDICTEDKESRPRHYHNRDPIH